MRSFIRTFVSKSKRRYTENGFNLDLTYITPRLIAMACPAQGTESIFRNPMSEVMRFLTSFHDNHFKVINLCAERNYDPVQLGGNVERIPFGDHQPAPLNEILRFCVLTETWLAADERNIVVTHCKAGKGRTGMMLSCYLLYSRYCPDPTTALHYYANQRTHDGKGVTIPSQKRYVHYFSDMVCNNLWKLSMPKLQLTNIRVTSSSSWKADVYVVISCNGGNGSYKLDTLLTTLGGRAVITISNQQKCISYDVEPTWVAGDVKVEFFERKFRRQLSLFYTWFNTLFVEGSQCALTSKGELDKPSINLDASFQVVFYFSHGLAEEKEGVICARVSDSLTAACRDRLSNLRDLPQI